MTPLAAERAAASTAVKQSPITMSAESLRAMQQAEHPKNQTRRVIGERYWLPEDRFIEELNQTILQLLVKACPYGEVGDQLWVRETIRRRSSNPPTATYVYDGTPVTGRGAPEMYMGRMVWQWPKLKVLARIPRYAARYWLEIVEVRVQRLHDISDADICAELGAPLTWPGPGPEPHKRDLRGRFAEHWDWINKKRGHPWLKNDWVWSITFKRIEAPAL